MSEVFPDVCGLQTMSDSEAKAIAQKWLDDLALRGEKTKGEIDTMRTLSKTQAAALLGISVKLLDRILESGRLSSVLIGKRKRITVGDLSKYVEESRQPSPVAA
jgi:excisionase family DNA binding protein